MKKPLPRALAVIAGVVAGVLISSALYAVTGFNLFGRFHEKPPLADEAAHAGLTGVAYTVLEYIKDEDFVALSHIAHPELGVVFSPCATLKLSANKCFRAEQIAAFGEDTNLYVWGVSDGSGEPLEMTPVEYFNRFVFKKDYSTAPLVGVNYIVRSGNALENIKDVFPNIQFVEFHIPGSHGNPAEDSNWSSLRLGFEEYDGRLWLAVIAHSEWTV